MLDRGLWEKNHAGITLEATSVNNSVNVLKRPNTTPKRISKRWYGSLRDATCGSELAAPDIHTEIFHCI
jgi:hypothetical protein